MECSSIAVTDALDPNGSPDEGLRWLAKATDDLVVANLIHRASSIDPSDVGAAPEIASVRGYRPSGSELARRGDTGLHEREELPTQPT